MKKITVYILLLLLLSSICSCLDDKNNYDYTPIIQHIKYVKLKMCKR